MKPPVYTHVINQYGAFDSDHPLVAGLEKALNQFTQAMRELALEQDATPADLRVMQAYAVNDVTILFAELSLRKAMQLRRMERSAVGFGVLSQPPNPAKPTDS